MESGIPNVNCYSCSYMVSSFVSPNSHRSCSVKDDDHDTDKAVSFCIPHNFEVKPFERYSACSVSATQRPGLRSHYILNCGNDLKFGDFEAFLRTLFHETQSLQHTCKPTTLIMVQKHIVAHNVAAWGNARHYLA